MELGLGSNSRLLRGVAAVSFGFYRRLCPGKMDHEYPALRNFSITSLFMYPVTSIGLPPLSARLKLMCILYGTNNRIPQQYKFEQHPSILYSTPPQ